MLFTTSDVIQRSLGRVLELDRVPSEAPQVRNQTEFGDDPANCSSKCDTEPTRILEILGQSVIHWLLGDENN